VKSSIGGAPFPAVGGQASASYTQPRAQLPRYALDILSWFASDLRWRAVVSRSGTTATVGVPSWFAGTVRGAIIDGASLFAIGHDRDVDVPFLFVGDHR